jgi:hypothetical protein
MIEQGMTAEYRSAYNRPHRAIFRAEVWNHTEQIGEIAEILGGGVDCALTSQITRRGSLTVPAALMPKDESGLLAPFGNRLRLYRGIRYGNRDFMFRVFTGLIVKAERKPRQPCVVTFSDRAYEVDENDFEAVEESLNGRTVVEECVRLIREGVPLATFGTHDPINAQASPQVFDDSRSQACDQLADAGGAFWYALADGRFVIRRVPWAYQPEGVNADPVAVYDESAGDLDSTSGTITDYGTSMSRENVFNIVVGVADQPNGTEPYRAAVRDTNAGSATYIGGKFGRRVLKVELPSAAGTAVVRHGAETALRRARASAESLPWEMIPDPTLELGDLVQVNIDGRRLLRVVAEFNVPMTEGGLMTCSGRPIVLPNGVVITEKIGS